MKDLESLIRVLHVDPETLPGVPADEEFKEQSTGKPHIELLGRPLTALERQGFLEMWQRTTAINDLLAKQPYHDIEELEAKAQTGLERDEISSNNLLDVRFLYGRILREKANRFYEPHKRVVWLGYRQLEPGPPIEGYREKQKATPWDMPHAIFWDKSQSASARRAAWVLANHPEVTSEELTANMSLHDDEIAEAREIIRYNEIRSAFEQSPDKEPDHPKGQISKVKPNDIMNLGPELFVAMGASPEITNRVIRQVNNVLRFAPPDKEGELFIFWRKPEDGSGELELNVVWFFPQGEAA